MLASQSQQRRLGTFQRSTREHIAPSPHHTRGYVVASAKKVSLQNVKAQTTHEFEQPVIVIGSKPGLDLTLQDKGVEKEHAQITQQGGQIFIQPLSGDTSDVLNSSTNVWVGENELRAGVKYPLISGGELSIGTKDTTLLVTFDQAQSLGATEKLLVQGWMRQGGFGDQVEGMM